MNDYGTRQTDLAVRRAEWRLSRVYRQAQRDIDEKLKAWQKGHEEREKRYRQQVKDGKLSQADFDAWMRGQVFQDKQWQARKAEIDRVLLNADREAQRIINEGKLSVFADNANYIGYGLEHGANINTGFTLYDQQTVARLVKSDPQILPKPAPGVQKDKAYTYYNKLMNSAITQGIVQGETIPQIAKRIVDVTGERSYSSAVRNARTAYTGAQNAGRIEGLHQAQSLGIKVKKQWMATLDNRTRDTHADLDGQTAEVDEPFVTKDGNEIMFPGDPTAEASEVYNCRCTLVYVYPDYPSDMQRRDNLTGEIVGDMTYREWEDAKNTQTERIITGENVTPNYINPVNPITDQDKVDALAYDFVTSGYNGRPILAIDNGDGSYQALTGSHRIYAAREAGIDIPTKVLERNEATEQIAACNDDEERAAIAQKLYGEGKIDDDTLALLQKEEKLNYSDDVIKGKADKAQKWRDKQESDRAALEAEKQKAAERQAQEEKQRQESPEMQEYLDFRQAMIDKYGEDGMYGEMTDSEYDKLERLERIAYKGK